MTSEGDEESFPFPIVSLCTQERGHGWAAARDLKAGEVVMRCAPSAVALNDANATETCAGCLRQGCTIGQILKPCSGCHQVAWCSKCEHSAYQMSRHADECEALNMLKEREVQHGTTTLRLVLQMAIYASRARRDLPGPSEDEFGPEDAVLDSPCDVEALFGDASDLLPGGSAPSLNKEHCIDAAKMVKIITPACARASLDAFVGWFVKVHLNCFDVHASQLVEGVASASVAAGSITASQPASITAASKHSDASRGKRQRVNKGSKPEAQLRNKSAVGEAMYPSAAIFNHSCDPNCSTIMDEYGCRVVMTLKGVDEGEELFTSYIAVDAPFVVRQKHLLERYCFICDCSKCRRK